jgi:hypothetical protein
MKILINTVARREIAKNMVGNIRGDENMEVIIQPHIEKKSDEQRGWFHFLCREMSKETGYTEGEIKEYIKAETFGSTVVQVGDIQREVTCSSETDENGKARSKTDYSKLIDGAYRIGAEAGIALPNPLYKDESMSEEHL